MGFLLSTEWNFLFAPKLATATTPRQSVQINKLGFSVLV